MKLFNIIIIGTLIGCTSNPNNSVPVSDGALVYVGIPSEAYMADENEDYIVFLNDEAVEDSIEGLPPIKQVSLWTYDKDEKIAKRILLSHPNADGSWFSMERAVKIRVDSIPAISKVTILSWKDEPLKLLVEGCSDYRNVQSFIIDIDLEDAICLPTNRGLLGVSEEDGLLIMQSYKYYNEGGRYNIIEAFDDKGNRIASMDAKTRND